MLWRLKNNDNRTVEHPMILGVLCFVVCVSSWRYECMNKQKNPLMAMRGSLLKNTDRRCEFFSPAVVPKFSYSSISQSPPPSCFSTHCFFLLFLLLLIIVVVVVLLPPPFRRLFPRRKNLPSRRKRKELLLDEFLRADDKSDSQEKK